MKFRILITSLLFIPLFNSVTAQTFEGIIKFQAFKITNEKKKPYYDETNYIKESSLKSFMIDDRLFRDTNIYLLENSKSTFTINHNNKTISNDTSRCNSYYDFKDLKKTKKKKDILGYNCTLFKGDKMEYWITKDLTTKINYGFEYWKEYGTTLEMKTYLPNNTVIIKEATEIIPQKLSDEFFSLPDYPITKVSMLQKINQMK